MSVISIGHEIGLTGSEKLIEIELDPFTYW
jgi:hypothetical protein